MKKLLFSILIIEILGGGFVVWNETSPVPPEQVVARYISAVGVADATVCYDCLHPESKLGCYYATTKYRVERYTISNKISIKSEHWFTDRQDPVRTQKGDVLLVVDQQERYKSDLMNVECRYLLRKWKGQWLIRDLDRPMGQIFSFRSPGRLRRGRSNI